MSLYQTYRPQQFSDVTGQNHVKASVLRQITGEALGHAYLFSGPRGVGKTTMARLMAKRVNCLEPNAEESCLKCKNCEAVAEGRLLDLIEIDAASHTGVDNVREQIVEQVRFAPVMGKMKVFIIDEVHMLSKGAFNALLKTLEEPPKYVLFILATTELHKIPETIISRCQRFDFRTIDAEPMKERLEVIAKNEGISIDDDVLQEVIRRSMGCLRDAESLLSQLLVLDDKHVTAEKAMVVMPVVDLTRVVALVKALAATDVKMGINVVNEVVEGGADMGRFTDELIRLLRTALLLSLGMDGARVAWTDAQKKEIGEVFKDISSEQCRKWIKSALSAKAEQNGFDLPQLALELMVVDACDPMAPSTPASPSTPVAEERSETSSTPTPVKQVDAKPEPETLKDGPGAAAAPTKVETTPSSMPGEEARAKNSTVSLELVKKYWSTFQKALKLRHVSLPMTIEQAEPVEVDGSMVHIAVPFEFYADTINEPKNNTVLAEVMSEALNVKVGVMARHVAPKTDPAIASVLDAFGGEVVSA